jgi:hypothetical protein
MQTCQVCGGFRTLTISVKLSWWDKLLQRPEMVIETCKACSGIGLVRGPEDYWGASAFGARDDLELNVANSKKLDAERAERERRRLAAGRGKRQCECQRRQFDAEDADDVCGQCRSEIEEKEQWKKSLAETIRSGYSGKYCGTCGAHKEDIYWSESENDSQIGHHMCKRCGHRV